MSQAPSQKFFETEGRIGPRPTVSFREPDLPTPDLNMCDQDIGTAIARWLDENHRRALHFLARRGATRELGEDLLQAGLIRVLTAPKTDWAGPDHLHAYIMRTLANLSIDHGLATWRKPEHEPFDELTDTGVAAPFVGDDVEDLLKGVLASESPETRLILMLYHDWEMPQDQIAALLDKSENAISKRVCRFREKAHQHLSDQKEHAPDLASQEDIANEDHPEHP